MGPNHPPRHPTENGGNEDDDVLEYENDGWRVGFEVQMNGIGHEQEDGRPGENDEGESSGWESDPPSEVEHEAEPDDDDEKYTGYQVIPEDPSGLPETSQPQNGEDQIEDDSTRDVDETPATSSTVSPRIRAEFAILRSTPAVTEKFSIEHQPRPIELNDEKIESIRSTMTGFTLPPPPKWENFSVKEVDLTKILETLRES
ncbi:unnamed protein product, partial [Mesorhabditis belari]|uniref:Male-enhanced antigen 1 n=1 Tax=Mesorhabditis belari TaxID=2138241 RepID=A0AAF3J3Z0_9BILA